MHSNRYVALHCCQEKYFDEITLKGIEKDTKAVFMYDLNKTENQKLLNTLAVLIYHGIGIAGWEDIINRNKKLDEIDKNLTIVIAEISENQEKFIKEDIVSNYYKIYGKNEETMKYYKIRDIGKIEKVVFFEKIPLNNTSINIIENINPIKDRFFIKNDYSDEDKKSNKTTEEIEKLCYKIANDNLNKIKDDIIKINEYLMKGTDNEQKYKNDII